MKPLNYTCIKCGNKTYEVGEIRATGGIISKIFDVQTEKFSYTACSRCSFSEFYKAKSSQLGNVFDFFTN